MKSITKNQVLFVLVVFLTLGISLGSSNYQFQFERIEKGSLVDLPVIYEGHALAHAATKQFIDATESTTYGTVTNGPPDGFGDPHDGPTYDTELLEASYSYEQNTTLETTAFPSLPSGWAVTEWTVTGGEAIANEYFSTRTLTTKAYNLASYDSVFIDFSWAAYDGVGVSASNYQLQKYEGSWVTVLNCPSLSTSYVDESEEVVSSYGSFQWRWHNDGTSDTERLKVDDVTIKGQTSNTYYRFQALFRFDNLTLGLSDYTLFVDFYTPLTGSDSLTFRIEDDTDPLYVVGDLEMQDSFNDTVTEYIISSTMYLKIEDYFFQNGDTVQTTAYIERIFLQTGVVEWGENDEAIFILDAPFHMWGYNSALIILGLIMIPTSTIYLAHGVKNDRSMDRLFYGLIIFLLGCGLLVGGIIP